jgi:hypothetical protein
MARKIAATPRRDDWAAGETVELPSGEQAVSWFNVVTGERATLAHGVHPFENRNAAGNVVALPAVQATAPDDSEEDPAVQSAADRLAVLMQTAGETDQCRVKLYRLRDDGTEGYLKEYPPEIFESGGLDMIRKEWGSGTFNILLYGYNANGKFCRRGSQRVYVEPLPTPTDTRASNPTDSATMQLLSAMTDKLASLETRLQSQPDPMAQMMQTLALMKSMREAFGVDSQPKVSAVDQMKEILNVIEGAKKMRSMIDPDPEPSDPLLALAPRVLDLVGGAMQRQGAMNGTPVPSVEIPQSMQSPQHSQTGEPMNETDIARKFAGQWLYQHATSGDMSEEHIEEVAYTIVENLPDDALDALCEENWHQSLGVFDARLTHPSIRPFLEKVRAKVLEFINSAESDDGSDDEAPDPAGPPAAPIPTKA